MNSNTHLEMGRRYARDKNYSLALNEFKKAFKFGTDTAELHLYIGEIYQEKGEYDKAIKEFNKAIALGKVDEAYFKLGKIYGEKEEYDLAKKAFTQLLKIDPADERPHFELGMIYEKTGENALAKKEFQKAVKFNYKKSEGYFHLGKLYEEKGDYELAVEALKKLVKIDPADVRPHLQFGMIYEKTGKSNLAEKEFQKSIELNYKKNEGYFHLGKLYGKKGDYELAKKAFINLLKIDPKDERQPFELGMIYEKAGENTLAEKEFQKAVKLNYKKNEGYFHLGKLYEEKGDYELAIKELKKVADNSSVSEQSHFTLGKIYKDKGKFDLAIKEFKRIQKKISPEYEKIQLNLGQLYREIGKYELSAKELDKAIKAKSHKGDLFYENKLLNEQEISQGRTFLQSKPQGLLITLTHKCNEKCIMCNIGDPSWNITEKTIEEIKEYLPYLQEIRWQGGEVFLSEFFVDLFEETLKESFHLQKQAIITNGILLNEEWVKKLVSDKVNMDITISIDGATKEVYEKIRRGGVFETLLENIRVLNKYRKRFQGRTNTMINVVVMKSNYHQLNEFLEFAKEYEFDRLQFAPIEEVIGYYNDKENIFVNKDRKALSYIHKVMPGLIKRAGEYNIIMYNCIPMQVISEQMDKKSSERKMGNKSEKTNKKSSEQIDSKKEQKNRKKDDIILNDEKSTGDNRLLCYLPWQFLSINYGGLVSPHCSCRNKTGNIGDSSLEELWNNEMMQLYRKSILEGKYQNICNFECVKGVIPREYLRLTD